MSGARPSARRASVSHASTAGGPGSDPAGGKLSDQGEHGARTRAQMALEGALPVRKGLNGGASAAGVGPSGRIQPGDHMHWRTGPVPTAGGLDQVRPPPVMTNFHGFQGQGRPGPDPGPGPYQGMQPP